MRRFSVPTLIWCGLCALTILSVTLVETQSRGSLFAAISVVLIAATKARLVIVHYMEANRAARHWRFLFETWNFAVVATILISHAMSRGGI